MRTFNMIDRGEQTNEYGETRMVIEIREGEMRSSGLTMLTVSAVNVEQAIEKWHEANGMGTVEPYLAPEPIWFTTKKETNRC